MQSRWNDAEADRYREQFRAAGERLALRIYTSHLIGGDPDLVLHGGGNTSVKATARDLLGREIEVLHVKGSGADLGDLGPDGLPAVRLEPLRELRALTALTDEAMVSAVRAALLDSSARNPSVETLLHAFLPHVFVDHTHADAILALTDQPDGEALAREVFGEQVAILPWIMPGFPLAQAVAAAFEAAPDCRGIVLQKHGLFTFGDDARTSYERTIELVDLAERFCARRIGGRPAMLVGEPAPLPSAERRALLTRALPALRGAVAVAAETALGQRWRRVVCDARSTDDLAAFSAHGAAPALCAKGPITPDHVIRTKGSYLFVPRAEAARLDLCQRAVAGFAAGYERYYERAARRTGLPMIAPQPVVAVVEGAGLVAFGSTPKAARIAADIAEHTLRVKAAAHALGDYQPLDELELAEMEYWPLERRKLGTAATPPLLGQVAFVTGAAGAIGCGIVEALLAHGACVFATDLDGERLAVAAERAGGGDRLVTATGDLTDPARVAGLFDECTLAFGGVDCVVPNAGIAHVQQLAEMDPERFRAVLEVNTTATMLVLREAARVLRAQGTGGSVVLQASKNVFAPGAAFGAYSASKAAALQLARVAALEFAEFGVRVNAVNADAVFGDEQVPSQLWQEVGPGRMQARGLDAAGLQRFYRERSLLGVRVLPRHVGEAVAFFAAGLTPTTGAVLPVDGGLPEAFPR
ncbi:MAG: bifunctional aldolase/short-chain dehydrogenase [Planctomycetes bacterium]|nr:bifunctional aldolase/short-chain dehydrogenase [Planctomycetota bacterium]